MKIGRPTKYDGEKTIQKIYIIMDRMSQEKAVKEFFSFCSVEHIADALGVCRDTIYDWTKKYPDFSYTIKAWETKRNMLFYALVTSPQLHDSKWIFLAKNWLGMSDKKEHEHKGEVNINYISHIPPTEKKEKSD